MIAGNLIQNIKDLSLNPETNSNFNFTIEGNIGCGKSTFLNLLKPRLPDAHWIEEPVNEWINIGGKNLNILDQYYIQPKRWGFTFQIFAIHTRLQKLRQACQRFPDKLKISERSILADKYVFAELMRDLESMDASEYEIYKSLYKNFATQNTLQKTKIIYLRCSPEKCHQRIKIRKRQQEEGKISLDYLKRIHQKHENWFKTYDPSKVLVIDTNADFKDNEQIINDMIHKTIQFIKGE